MSIKACKHQFQNIKHEMSFKSILQSNPEQKSSIENIHNKSVLHPTPCLEKQSSKVINNIPQVLLLSWVATSLSCPCLHCLNTEWFALDWSLLDGWAAERQHQKIRGKNQNYSKIVCLQPWCCKSTGRLWSPSYTCRNQFLSGVPSPLTTHKYQSGKGTQLHCAHRGHCWAVPGTRWSGNKLLDVKEKTTGNQHWHIPNIPPDCWKRYVLSCVPDFPIFSLLLN